MMLSGLVVILLGFISVYLLLLNVLERRKNVKLINKIPGPPGKPIVGNARPGQKLSNPDRFRRFVSTCKIYGSEGICKIWYGPFPAVFISSPEAAEPIVTSNTELGKGAVYDFIKPWLGEGLITTSNSSLWFTNRRQLTPAFHFQILEDFLSVMNEQTEILVNILRNKATGETFDILMYIKMCALDIICESAMGTTVKAQQNPNAEYVTAMEEFGLLFPVRNQKFWFRFDFIYKMSKYYKTQEKCLKIMKQFTNSVVKERKAAILSQEADGSQKSNKRKAFLDLVLSTKTEDGRPAFSDEQIQEQVDTFMFAGHDTTTHGISWCLYLLGHYPEIQEKCFIELKEIFGNSDRPCTMNDLRKMKYLECCIKESMRIYPSVMAIGRNLSKDLKISEYDVPAGTSIFISIYALHHNPKIWEDPERFDPERFKTENISGKHPYAFIPFSAGPRNCLGQKFALNEEKVVLSGIIRNFKFQSVQPRDKLNIKTVLILSNEDGFKLKLTPR